MTRRTADKILPTPRLLEGWWRHQDSQTPKVHMLHTVADTPMFRKTLCGQVWMTESAVKANTPTMRESQACERCLAAEPRWRAKD